MLNTHINIRSMEYILSEELTSQDPDEEDMKKPSLRSQRATRPLNI
jgi:hypothetical protein